MMKTIKDKIGNTIRNGVDRLLGAGQPGEQAARGRDQTRPPFFASFFASLGERAEAAAQALCAQADRLSFREIGRLMEGGALARVSPGAWTAILCAVVLMMLALWREMSSLLGASGLWSVLLSLLGSLLCVLLPAVLGLSVSKGGCIPKRPLSAEQRLCLIAAGTMCICPMTLLADFPAAVMARFGVPVPAQEAAALPMHLFLPMALVSGLIAPACEELFFRGYLLHALRARGAGMAALMSALIFAAAHGMDQFAVRMVLGLLLAAVVLRTESLAAGLIVHSLYNLTILFASFAGLSGLFSGLSPVSCALRIAGTAGFAAALLRFRRARRPALSPAKPAERPLRKRERMLLLGAAAALIVSQILAGVMNG